MHAPNPLAIFAPGLNRAGLQWMTVGSVASMAYGEIRTTMDVDIVAVVQAGGAKRFCEAFPEEHFYCPPVDVVRVEASRPERGHFNLIDNATMLKADIYVATNDPLQRWAFLNRRQLTVETEPVWLAPPEYVIVHKLEFLREGGSEKHIRDIRGMLAVTEVDRAFLEKEIAQRGLDAGWRRCTGPSGADAP